MKYPNVKKKEAPGFYGYTLIIFIIAMMFLYAGIKVHDHVYSFTVPIDQPTVESKHNRACNTMEQDNIQLFARNAVLMDGESGNIVYDKDGDMHRPNASTTKIMTCILALECGDTGDEVEVSSYAAKQPEVRLGAREGERYSLEDMLYAMMLESYNDAAVIIAEHIGGSVSGFAEMMNKKADEIGCKSTYFITPNGLDSSDTVGVHGTSAGDLARIMRYCILVSPQKDNFLKITGTASYSFTDKSGQRTYTCVNHNAFLNMSQDALTGKTGFTCDAGYCYVGAARKDGRTYIWSLLGCGWPNNKTYKWKDSKTLLTYGEEHIDHVGLVAPEIPERYIVFSSESAEAEKLSMMCRPEEDVALADSIPETDISYKYKICENIKAPVCPGAVVGELDVYIDGVLFDVIPVTSQSDIPDIGFKEDLLSVIRHALI